MRDCYGDLISSSLGDNIAHQCSSSNNCVDILQACNATADFACSKCAYGISSTRQIAAGVLCLDRPAASGLVMFLNFEQRVTSGIYPDASSNPYNWTILGTPTFTTADQPTSKSGTVAVLNGGSDGLQLAGNGVTSKCTSSYCYIHCYLHLLQQ